VRDAFQTMRRQLEDYQRKRRQHLKSPPLSHESRVVTEGPI
jgi:hypothetical protein